MDEKLKKISCDPMCGFSVQSHVEKEVLDMAKLHVKSAHPEAKYTDEDYMKLMQTL